MLVTFFALILLFAANPVLVPNSMKPSPIIVRGKSKPAVVPNFWLKGPAAVTDSVAVDSTASRADSLEAGTVDPETFSPEEMRQQYRRAIHLWLQRRQFLDEIHGYSIDPVPWT